MKRCTLIAGASFAPLLAHAHSPTEAGVIAGMLHPLTGLDHLLIMLAAGLLAARWARSYLVLAAWGAALVLGWTAGTLWPHLAREGWMVMGLLAAAGATLVASRRALNAVPALMAAALFAQALLHGAEAPEPSHQLEFGAGFLAITVAFVTGLALATRRLQTLLPRLQQIVGLLALAFGLGKLMV